VSADNVVYVQKCGERYYVWDDSASNEAPEPPEDAQKCDTRSYALTFAHDLVDEIGYVEYGVRELEKDERNYDAVVVETRELDGPIGDMADFLNEDSEDLRVLTEVKRLVCSRCGEFDPKIDHVSGMDWIDASNPHVKWARLRIRASCTVCGNRQCYRIAVKMENADE
jgi:hypothetical protein